MFTNVMKQRRKRQVPRRNFISLDNQTVDPTQSVLVKNIPFLNEVCKTVNSTRVHNLQARQHEVEMIFSRLPGNT